MGIKRGALALFLIVGIALGVYHGAEAWKAPVAVEGEQIALSEPKHETSYFADLQIDPAAHRVTGTLTVRFQPQDDRAYFHLYPNVFQSQADMGDPNWERILGKQREPGGMEIKQVRVNGKEVPVQVEGKVNTLLHVPIPTEKSARLPHAEVEMRFELQVPYNKGRLSYNDHAMWLGNWLPILAVKEKDGWRLDPYASIGDPFYSQIANYHLRVMLEEKYQLATSGVESVAVVTQSRPQRVTTYEIDAWNVRDLAMVVMDESYRKTSGQVGDTVVHTWSQEGDDAGMVERLHEVAQESLRYFSEQFGTYPYKEYDVVKTGGFFGGMEYPGIVFVQEDLFERYDPSGEAVVAHETAHQWFYALVGNDEVREAWLDESLSDYATMAYLTAAKRPSASFYIQMRKAGSQESRSYAGRGLTVWQSVEQFPDWNSYVNLVYGRGSTMLWELREAWGEERIHTLLRQYVKEHQYGLATGERFVSMLSQEAGTDASPFIDYWLHLKQEKQVEAAAWLEKSKHE
ncbi:MAG TPA: M1 family metallopeptidase [Brevibacillus sp.]|nr:M1 family metallopeptidase [Brevibacillus sp.]